MPLCGNSIATDRWFIARDMPELDNWLHYRMIDVSSVKELARRWYPRAYFASPSKHGGHRALADIIESVRELRYYRDAVFVPQPGPDSATAREIAARYRQPAAGRAERVTAFGDRTRESAALVRPDILVSAFWRRRMVGVAQLVERQVVVLDAAGSSPVTHPT